MEFFSWKLPVLFTPVAIAPKDTACAQTCECGNIVLLLLVLYQFALTNTTKQTMISRFFSIIFFHCFPLLSNL